MSPDVIPPRNVATVREKIVRFSLADSKVFDDAAAVSVTLVTSGRPARSNDVASRADLVGERATTGSRDLHPRVFPPSSQTNRVTGGRAG